MSLVEGPAPASHAPFSQVIPTIQGGVARRSGSGRESHKLPVDPLTPCILLAGERILGTPTNLGSNVVHPEEGVDVVTVVLVVVLTEVVSGSSSSNSWAVAAAAVDPHDLEHLEQAQNLEAWGANTLRVDEDT